MNTLKLFGIFLVCAMSNSITAQTTIQGSVKNRSNEPLIGALVYLKGKYDGASTDDKGNFSLKTKDTGNVIIVTSYVSYKKNEKAIKIAGKSVKVDIVLDEDANNLDPVTITAGQFEAGDEKKTTILNSLDIVTTAGSGADIYSVLKTLPGAGVVNNQTGLFVRGGDGREATTIIDGIRVPHPFYGNVPDIGSRGRFSPFLFRGTYFSSGGYSAEYGQAMSSALILNTEGLADQTHTSIDLMPIGTNIGHTHLWESTSLGGYLSYTNLNPYYKLAPSNTIWKDAPISYQGSITYRQMVNKTGLLKFYSQYSYGSISVYTPDSTRPIINNLYSGSDHNLYSNLSYFDKIGDKWTSFSAISVCTDDTRHILHLNNQSGVNYYNIPINQSDLVVQGKTRFTRSLGELSNIKSGLEFGHSNFSSNSATDTSLQKENFVAAFTESDMYLTKNIVLRLGVRAENSTLVNKSNAAPRISMAYKFRDESQFSLAYGIFYQSPDISYIKQGLHNYEEATHYVVNFQKMSDNRTFRMETFYKKYNKLTLIDPNNQSLSTNGNGYAQGAELFWRDKKSFNNIDYWISYSFLDTKRKYIYYPMNIVPDFASKHTFSMVYKQFVPQISSNLGLTYTAASGHTYTNPNDTKPLNSYTPPYNNLSFTASYIHNVKGTWIVVVASVSNILGFDNILSYKYSANGSYRIPIKESDKRFYFIGVFLSIGRDNSNDVF